MAAIPSPTYRTSAYAWQVPLFFSKLDLVRGYRQVPVCSEKYPKPQLSTQLGPFWVHAHAFWLEGGRANLSEADIQHVARKSNPVADYLLHALMCPMPLWDGFLRDGCRPVHQSSKRDILAIGSMHIGLKLEDVMIQEGSPALLWCFHWPCLPRCSSGQASLSFWVEKLCSAVRVLPHFLLFGFVRLVVPC